VGALLEGLPTRLSPEEEADMDGLSQLIQASCRVVAAAAAVPASSGWGGGFGAALEELLVVPGQLGSPGPGWALQQRVAAGGSMVHGEHGAPSGQAHGRSGQDAVTEAPVKLLPVVGNALVEEVTAGGAGGGGRSTHSMLQCHDLDSREVQAAREALQAPYGANFHYHSGERGWGMGGFWTWRAVVHAAHLLLEPIQGTYVACAWHAAFLCHVSVVSTGCSRGSHCALLCARPRHM
jgi:hypothetical protein